MYIRVGVYIGNTAVAKFYIGPVKKAYAVFYDEENFYLKDLRIIC